MHFHPRAQKEVLVKGRSVDIINLIEGSLKLQEMWLILEEQTSQPPRNQSETVQVPFCSWVVSCFVIRKEGACLACNSSAWTCERHLYYLNVQQTCQPFLGCHSCLSDVSFVCRKIESYIEDSTSKESLSALLRATSALPDVFQVSDVFFIVCGFPAPTIHSVIAT